MLRLDHISYSIKDKKENRNILSDVSFQLNKGEIVGIAGESGSGKTTLAKIICGILPANSGELFFYDSKIFPDQNEKAIQLLFQHSGELINPFRRVRSVLLEAMKLNGISTQKTENDLLNLLNLVNIDSHLLDRKGYALSGGEQQRIALARLLAVNPKLIVLDEPFSAQDVFSAKIMIDLILNLRNTRGISFLVISHDLIILSKIADRILVMNNGEIVEEGLSSEIINSPKNKYSQYLISCLNYDLPPEDERRDEVEKS